MVNHIYINPSILMADRSSIKIHLWQKEEIKENFEDKGDDFFPNFKVNKSVNGAHENPNINPKSNMGLKVGRMSQN